ncbi:hypothetical protein ACFT54_10220 [Streptomyces cinereoruber]|uniref:hypothetical protein n=1 Tax=Streptomyces cinereoruber TaxID=67260 RepID=UPI0036377EC8
MTGTDASLRRQEPYAEAYLDTTKQITASAAWQPVGVQVTLPEAGTYEITGEAQGVISYTAPTTPSQTNTALSYRLFNVTAGAAVARSQRIAFLFSVDPGTTRGQHGSPALHSFVTVTAPTVIRMEHYRYQSQPGGTWGVSETRGGVNNALGDTALRYRRMDV